MAAQPGYLYRYHREAILIINTSDVCFPSQAIPVTVDVIGAGDEIRKTPVIIFPSPADYMLNIASEFQIEKIMIQNHFGQVLDKKEPE